MINLLNKKVTVEQIHAEFDSAQDRLLKEMDCILKEIQIPTESSIEKKAKMLKEVGFTNEPSVKKAEQIKIRTNGLLQKQTLTKTNAELLQHYKFTYPNEKFLTKQEMDRICKKYNLIYATIDRYIKEVPDKNLQDIYKTRPLLPNDVSPSSFIINKVTFENYSDSDSVKEANRLLNQHIIGKEFDRTLLMGLSINSRWIINRIAESLGTSIRADAYIKKIEYSENPKNELIIAAPKSHFNLAGLTKNGFSFLQSKIFEVKDPVVMEYCKGDFIRVITKWGTDDDQSFLDESLINEKLN